MVSGHKTKNLYIYASVNASTIIGKKKKTFGFRVPKYKKKYFAFQSFDFECTWWMLFQ